MQILKLVLSDYWFDEIKSGRKTHEYRKVSSFWLKRFSSSILPYEIKELKRFPSSGHWSAPLWFYRNARVEFQRAYRKDPERMTFKIQGVRITSGHYTDLKCDCPVFDIELGERVK